MDTTGIPLCSFSIANLHNNFWLPVVLYVKLHISLLVDSISDVVRGALEHWIFSEKSDDLGFALGLPLCRNFHQVGAARAVTSNPCNVLFTFHTYRIWIASAADRIFLLERAAGHQTFSTRTQWKRIASALSSKAVYSLVQYEIFISYMRILAFPWWQNPTVILFCETK